MATLRTRKRKLKDGVANYWVVDYSVTEGGRTRRKQDHFRIQSSDPERARHLAEVRRAEVERKIARRKLSKGRSIDDGPADIEIADWLDAFCKAVRPNCGDGYHGIIVYTLEKFRGSLAEEGVLTTGQLRRQHFSAFVTAMRQKGNKPKSIHNDLSVIKRAVQWGIDEGWLEPNLVRSFPSVKVPKKKRRALSQEEIEELLAASEGTDMHDVIMLALYTGGRRGELVQLRCTDVDLAAGVIHFRAEITKAGEHGDLPIHPRLRPLLEERVAGNGFLLGHPDGTPWMPQHVSRSFTALVRERLEWNGVTFHGLRHTFGTRLAASGKISPFELQKLMRHKSITTSMIYVNLAGQKLPDIDVF